MLIRQTKQFENKYKKLQASQKREVDLAIREVVANPNLGELKKGDLKGVQVYKFRISNQLTLLAYRYDKVLSTLTLLALGSHENFYRDLKR
jgi:mRNA-degrading endonuclease RelE of RelBE toxin-antitoxin system